MPHDPSRTGCICRVRPCRSRPSTGAVCAWGQRSSTSSRRPRSLGPVPSRLRSRLAGPRNTPLLVGRRAQPGPTLVQRRRPSARSGVRLSIVPSTAAMFPGIHARCESSNGSANTGGVGDARPWSENSNSRANFVSRATSESRGEALSANLTGMAADDATAVPPRPTGAAPNTGRRTQHATRTLAVDSVPVPGGRVHVCIVSSWTALGAVAVNL